MILCPNCKAQNRDTARFCGKCGAWLILGGEYRVVEVIKPGGMGTVYEAESGGRFYAVKEMRDTFANPKDRQDAINRFMAEALILARLSHPHIPKVHRHFIENDRYYLVMDFVEGEDLQAVLDRQGGKELPEEQVLTWALQLCAVLEYLHGQTPPVIFRDLKPANIMLRPSGDISLIDFGIAKLFNPAQQGTLIGTPGYAAPEQYQGLAEPRSDIFALGATLHHLLTGRDPQRHPPFNFPPVTAINPAITPGMEAIIQKALQMNLEERWASIREVRQALMSLAEPKGIAPLPPGALLANKRYEVVSIITQLPKLNAYLVRDRRHRYCARCGSTASKPDDEYCAGCGVFFFGEPVEYPHYLLRESLDQEVLAQEALIANLGLRHEGMMNILRAFEDRPYGPQPRFYLVSDLDEGISLAALSRPQPEEKVLMWGKQLAETLAYLHEHGVRHRNIRLENIRLVDSQAKLTNFNLAEKLPRAAPKEWFAEDVEALARLLHELLARQTPSPTVAAIFDKALSPDKEERYSTAEALAVDLEEALETL